MEVLKFAVGKTKLTEDQQKAAEVDGKEGIEIGLVSTSKTVKVVEGGLFAQDAAVDADVQEANFPKKGEV